MFCGDEALTDQPSRVDVDLPDWLSRFAAKTSYIESLEDRMDFVIEASEANIEAETGGPFAAAVFEIDTGRLVSLGVNLVLALNLSVFHAEIVAMTLAQRKLKTFDLGGQNLPRHELVTSTEPCAMCFGAIPWSGIVRVVSGARNADARRIGFDEGPKPRAWRAALEQRGIEVMSDIQRNKAKAVLSNYVRCGGQIYNSRGW
jgi:tRNA(Arg) A34 adenosine deaminase TadA